MTTKDCFCTDCGFRSEGVLRIIICILALFKQLLNQETFMNRTNPKADFTFGGKSYKVYEKGLTKVS